MIFNKDKLTKLILYLIFLFYWDNFSLKFHTFNKNKYQNEREGKWRGVEWKRDSREGKEKERRKERGSSIGTQGGQNKWLGKVVMEASRSGVKREGATLLVRVCVACVRVKQLIYEDR